MSSRVQIVGENEVSGQAIQFVLFLLGAEISLVQQPARFGCRKPFIKKRGGQKADFFEPSRELSRFGRLLALVAVTVNW